MNILVTAIGSMSAECVIKALKADNHYVVGCDIYSGEWHYETSICDEFQQAPLAKSAAYIPFLEELVKCHKIDFIFPLTDLEVDVLNLHRSVFDSLHCTVCFSSEQALSYARNKYKLYQLFKDDSSVPSIASWLSDKIDVNSLTEYPYIAKPLDGRSSEGIIKIRCAGDTSILENKPNYLIQEMKEGSVFTVDCVRQSATGKVIIIPREELLRTSNGAGLTVRLVNTLQLKQLAHYILDTLDINGCVNLEFIQHNNQYYLIDVNPRFSAGLAFSQMTGNNMVVNHLRCFGESQEQIDAAVAYEEHILIKKYVEIS